MSQVNDGGSVGKNSKESHAPSFESEKRNIGTYPFF
jgi:hypothetical protein